MGKYTKKYINLKTDKYTDEEKEAIAFNIIEYIQKRTKRGEGEGGNKWAPPADKYTKEYKESLDFKIAGKSSKVNLTLSGDMLDSISLLKSKRSSITIGIPDGDQDEAKAEGNIRGTYGKSRGNSKKARNFLALDGEEIDKILKKFPIENEKKRKKNLAEYLTALKAVDEALSEE